MAKKAKYDLIDKEECPEPFALLETCLGLWHNELSECRIALLWAYNVRPDKDGRLVLGKCMPVSEHDRLLHGYDRKIWFNREAWDAEGVTGAQRLALVDHEMSHIGPDLDEKSGEQKVDGHGRLVWRTVKHTIEDFHWVVARHGCYKADIASFCEAALKRDPNLNIFEQTAEPDDGSNVRKFRVPA